MPFFESLKSKLEPSKIKEFLDQYENYITEPEYHRPKRGKSLFHYHGFYKQLFDFLPKVFEIYADIKNRMTLVLEIL